MENRNPSACERCRHEKRVGAKLRNGGGFAINSIYFKNFMATATIVLVSFLLIGIAFVFIGGGFVISDARENMAANAQEISRIAAAVTGEAELESWDIRMTISMLSQGTGNHIFLCDANGYVVSCCDKQLACAHLGTRVPEAYLKLVEKDGVLNQLTDLGGYYENTCYVIGQRISDSEGGIIGYAFVSKDASSIIGAYGAFTYLFFLVSLAVMSLAVLMSFALSKALTKNLDEMAVAARKYSHGDFSMRISTTNKADEMGALTDSFNAMADSLEKAEQTRHEFIANVSHELKTPMTTIAGFAEGLLDGTIPQEESEKYLAIIADETRRLSRLVREMLDMSKMQENMTDPQNMKTFNLSEELVMTLLSFEARGSEKRLDVDVQLPDDALWVKGNQDSIHRVIYNLLDNAIKFAKVGGTLSLSAWTQGGKVYVSIADEGEVIPEDDLPFIFDRFHKSDRSRSLDRDGVGLGLYLVKSILDAHDEDIVCTSRDGVTKFVFSLKQAPRPKNK